MKTARILLVSGLMLAPYTTAHAGKLLVSAYGLDAPACGTRAAPCRSITRAIAEAERGDTIEVGPGRYGDLDRDGQVGPGDEAMDAGVLIRITKPLRVVSRDGSGATVIDAGGIPAGVGIYSDDVAFGAAKRGFTITGASSFGLFCDERIRNVRIEGNWARDNFHGIQVHGARARLVGNRAIANADTGFIIRSPNSYVADNVALANRFGIFAAGPGSTLVGNVLSANGPNASHAGIRVAEPALLRGNVITGNRGPGMAITSPGVRVIGNRIVGNTGVGIDAISDGGVITGNDIYANKTARGGVGVENCGLWNATGAPLAAPRNYWGAPTGPGADPADEVCFSAVDVAPAATKPFRVRARAAR